MNRRMKQFFTGILLASMMAFLLPHQILTVYAAGGRIAFSDKSVTVGSEVNINMKITSSGGGALSNATVTLSYDASMLEFVSGTGASGGAGTIRISIGGDTADAKELSSALKFKGLQAGTTKITVATEEVYDAANQIVTIDQMGNSTITLAALANASNNAALTGLKISPGTLTPEFSADVVSYTASVGSDVERIAVDAAAADGKAKVVLSGHEELQNGENQIICKVIAEDGTTVKDYTILVTRGEGGAQGTPEAIKVVTAANTVTIMPVESGVEIPEGLVECTLKIDGQETQGWVWASQTEHQYCVFYGMDEAGEKGFYRYDVAKKTMQRFFTDPIVEGEVSMEQYMTVAQDYNNLLRDYKLRLYIIFVLGGVAVLLLVAVIVLLTRNGRDGDGDDGRYQNYKEKLDEKKKPTRRITREEEYMRGLEAEEESVKEHESLKKEEMRLKKSLAREVNSPAKEDPVDWVPVNQSRARHQADSHPEEDDDFEFIDLDL